MSAQSLDRFQGKKYQEKFVENEELLYGIKGCVEWFQDNCNPSGKWEAESKNTVLVLVNTKSHNES